MAFRIGTSASRKRSLLLLRSYSPDWILTALLFVGFWYLGNIDGHRRSFDLNDTSIQHSYAVNERVSSLHLFLICALAPAVIVLLTALIYMRSWYDLHCGWLGLLLSLAITSVATDMIKITVGRPRPDLLDRCQPRAGAVNSAGPSYGLTTWDAVCTQTDRLPSGFRSFPSGHSSLSWAGLGFLTFYASGKLHIHDSKGLSFKTWLLALPLMGATLVAVSRTMDYRHHASDVIAGSLIGLAASWWCYRQYFPELAHPTCEQAYPPRIAREQDEERGSDSDDGTGGGLDSDQVRLTPRTSAPHQKQGWKPPSSGRGAEAGGYDAVPTLASYKPPLPPRRAL